MELKIEKVLDKEIIHFAEDGNIVTSSFNKITIEKNNLAEIINLPIKMWMKVPGHFRILRRLLRLDKSCVIPTETGYVAFWQGIVYHIGKNKQNIVATLRMIGCRNPLHNSVANIDGRELYFGEYGKPHNGGKSIYRSKDGGINWKKVYNISCDKIRHIHCCKWDPYEEKIWVFTGDFNGQCYILCADKDFKTVEWIGDGTQYYRTCNAFFKEESVHWIMDSPIKEVRHIKLDRKTRKIELKQRFPGPVWYSKNLEDNYYIAATAQETGPSHIDNKIHFMISEDLESWKEIKSFYHDGLPKVYFKAGVISFAEGLQNSSRFFIFCEAVKGYDGKSCRCSITKNI